MLWQEPQSAACAVELWRVDTTKNDVSSRIIINEGADGQLTDVLASTLFWTPCAALFDVSAFDVLRLASTSSNTPTWMTCLRLYECLGGDGFESGRGAFVQLPAPPAP
jgi:hypothetical protein